MNTMDYDVALESALNVIVKAVSGFEDVYFFDNDLMHGEIRLGRMGVRVLIIGTKIKVCTEFAIRDNKIKENVILKDDIVLFKNDEHNNMRYIHHLVFKLSEHILYTKSQKLKDANYAESQILEFLNGGDDGKAVLED